MNHEPTIDEINAALNEAARSYTAQDAAPAKKGPEAKFLPKLGTGWLFVDRQIHQGGKLVATCFSGNLNLPRLGLVQIRGTRVAGEAETEFVLRSYGDWKTVGSFKLRSFANGEQYQDMPGILHGNKTQYRAIKATGKPLNIRIPLITQRVAANDSF